TLFSFPSFPKINIFFSENSFVIIFQANTNTYLKEMARSMESSSKKLEFCHPFFIDHSDHRMRNNGHPTRDP
ncbi:unnamed protein product, partial [Hymenolepis diminuta]